MSFIIYALGDSALTLELGASISEALNDKVIAIERWLHENPFPGMKEVVMSYCSISVFYDIYTTAANTGGKHSCYQYVSKRLEEAYEAAQVVQKEKKVIQIPVCYEGDYAPDVDYIAQQKKLSREEVIAIHSGKTYRVYMVGFLPGFPYLAEVDERIRVPRKSRPRPKVEKGSVGIAGMQTGIYTVESPGGWQIIGRTPYRVFEPESGKLPALQPGDYVSFSLISSEEMRELI